MLKKNLHEFCSVQDQQMLKDQLKQIYETKETQPVQMTLNLIPSSNYSSSPPNSSNNKNNSQDAIKFNTTAYAFCNPCNEAFEFIVCTHTNANRMNELNNSNRASVGVSNRSEFSNNNGFSHFHHNHIHHVENLQPTTATSNTTSAASAAYNPNSHQYQQLGTYNLNPMQGGGTSYSSPMDVLTSGHQPTSHQLMNNALLATSNPNAAASSGDPGGSTALNSPFSYHNNGNSNYLMMPNNKY
jgi:hypothetical protein